MYSRRLQPNTALFGNESSQRPSLPFFKHRPFLPTSSCKNRNRSMSPSLKEKAPFQNPQPMLVVSLRLTTCVSPARSTGGIPTFSPSSFPICAIWLSPGMWWKSSELTVQQRRPGLAYFHLRLGSGCGAGFLHGVGEGVLIPLVQA